MSLSSVQVRVGGGVVAWELAPMIGAYHYGCSTREKKRQVSCMICKFLPVVRIIRRFPGFQKRCIIYIMLYRLNNE